LPHAAHRHRKRCDKRAANLQRKIESRRFESAVKQVFLVIDDIDPANEGSLIVHQRKLAVQATKRLTFRPKGAERPEHPQVQAGLRESLGKLAFRLSGPETINHHLYVHATRGRPRERGRNSAAGRVIVENIGLNPYGATRSVDRQLEGREKFSPSFKQNNLVARLQRRRTAPRRKQRA
jgi:hypothetical protein